MSRDRTSDYQPRPFADLGVDPRSIVADPVGGMMEAALPAAAMRLISAFNWADHALGSLALTLARAPRLAFDLLYGIHSDGIRRSLAVDFIRKYLRDADQPLFEPFWSEMNWLYGARNVVAHWLWHASLVRRDVLVLIDAPMVAEDVVRWQDASADAKAIQARAAVPLLIAMPSSEAHAAAGYVEVAELDGLRDRVMATHNDLRLVQTLAETEESVDHIGRLRDVLRIRAGKIPPRPALRPRLGSS